MGTLHWGGVGGGLAKPGSYMSYGRNYLLREMPSPNVGGPLSVIRVLDIIRKCQSVKQHVFS